VANSSPGRAADLGSFIDVSELELKVATGARAASMDHMGAKRRVQAASQATNAPATPASALPSIGGKSSAPTANIVREGVAQPTIVLPHSEPLSDDQKKEHRALMDLFGLQLVTCFFSKTWSTR